MKQSTVLKLMVSETTLITVMSLIWRPSRKKITAILPGWDVMTRRSRALPSCRRRRRKEEAAQWTCRCWSFPWYMPRQIPPAPF
eukprot:g1248.t1